MTENPWLQTFSGVAFNLVDPKPDMVRLVDVAHALSRLARFNGHAAGPCPFSVAQHSLLVESLLPDGSGPVLRLHALLHDAHEAYVGDIPSPVKWAIDAFLSRDDWLRQLTDRIDGAVWKAFVLDAPAEDEAGAIRRCDAAALLIERDALMRPPPKDWRDAMLGGFELADATGTLTPMPPGEAKAAFTARFRTLMIKRRDTTG